MNESETVFREQVVAQMPRLRRFARALTRHAQDADDLVQLAVERALIRVDQWRPDSSVLNWMLAIVRNAWLDEVRSRRRRDAVLTSVSETISIPDPSAGSEVERWSIQSALERLPDDQRMAVALVLIEGLSYKEAAAVMATPIGTLTSRLARGRLALESMLGEGVAPRTARGVEQ